MKPLELLATATLVFTAVRLCFSIVQWIADKEGDKFVRRNLDALYDHLDQFTLSQIARRLLVRTVTKVRAALQRPGRPRLWLLTFFLLLNILAYLLAQGIFCSLQNDCGGTLGHDSVLREYGPSQLMLWFSLVFIGSTALQVSCLLLVHRMLTAAATARNVRRALSQIVFACALLSTTFVAQYAIQQLSTYAAFGLGPYWEKMLSNVIEVKPYFIATIVLSLAAGFPLVAFILTLGTLLMLRLLPNSARVGLGWLVWKVTTDNTPVIERLGYVAGGIASAASALLSYLKA